MRADAPSDLVRLARFVARAAVKSAIVLSVPAALPVVYVAAVRRTGELLPPASIAALSVSSQRMEWLNRYYDTGRLHKLDVATAIAPRVVVVGSSRVLQVRGRFFSKLSD